MESLITHYLLVWEPLGYILVFIGMIFEGEAVLFSAAFLTQQGLFNPIIIFIAALWGALLGDDLWYSLGRKLKNPPAIINKWAEKVAKPFDKHLAAKPLRTILLSKFIYGIAHAIFFRAGILKLRWIEIEKYDILATLSWMIIIAVLGYSFSASLIYLKHYLRYAEIALLLGLIIFLTLGHFISKQSKKKL